MRREGSALAGAGTVMMKELGDNLSSTRMRLLELLVFLTGAGAVFATIGEVRDAVGEDPFQALSGASALRGFYTSGLLMHRPDEDSAMRKLEIELRNGKALPTTMEEYANAMMSKKKPVMYTMFWLFTR